MKKNTYFSLKRERERERARHAPLLSTISRTDAALWSKADFQPIVYHHPQSISPSLPFLKRILEAVFCEGVQHRLEFCLDYLNCIKMATFQFYLQLGKQKGHRGTKSGE
jgi:hypothetical protein